MTFLVNHQQPLNGNNVAKEKDEAYMQQALSHAHLGAEQGEVPVGAILVLNDTVIASAANGSIQSCDPTAHAEILALKQGALALGNYRLLNTTLYVTLEPCLMCIGAMVHARITRLVYGAYDLKSGAVTSCATLLDAPFLNHHVSYCGGVLAPACGEVLRTFFKARRRKVG
ncbi:MAG: tRNA adenosine(34) deaminase TadA [Gammaproteobacteria bacterium]|nr:tRNA adenosine(34) deaminase TadA [Gammaproteobacteria bacterium]